ncbi:MAG: serine hydrolase domain-containing protein [Microthrixaceae bacterium]
MANADMGGTRPAGAATDPVEDGLDAGVLETLRERIQAEVDDGTVPAGQIAIGLDGRIVHRENFGAATDDSRFAVFSVTKAFIAGVVWQLLAEGSLEIDTPVIELVPSFAAAKGMTLEHLLTHTGGFPAAPLGPPQWDTPEGRAERYSHWRLQYPPGEHFEYHPTSGHWVIAEMIEAVEGSDYRTVLQNRLLDPLGLEGFSLGGETGRTAAMEELTAVGEPPTPEEIQEVLGTTEFDLGEVTPEILLAFNYPEVRAVGIPAAGGISDAASIATYYQHLLHNSGDTWKPSVLADGTARVHCNLPDPVHGAPANRTLGLILAGDDGQSALRGMGHTVSPQTFGHNGAGGQIAWADPASGISFAFCTSGIDRNFISEARRTSAIASVAGELRA